MSQNSPLVSKLRSNKNYKVSSLIEPKKKRKQYHVVQDDLSSVVNNICSSICSSSNSVPNVSHEEEEFLSKIELNQEDLVIEKISDNNQIVSIVDVMNQLVLDDDLKENSWRLFKTQKNGYKLYSIGYTYTVDKPTLALVPEASKIYWKCEDRTCPGRAMSNELAISTSEPPRTIIRKIILESSTECISSMCKKTAMRQIIQRERNKTCFSGFNAKCLSKLDIPPELRFTYRDKSNFYMFDTGAVDRNRVIIFSTQNNIKLLSSHKEWYSDGTFDISPTLFAQVYSIHININNTDLPMLYSLLPNKKESTYKKLFQIIKNDLKVSVPDSINCDFEMAAINAAKKVFGCNIHGCYFHLSQSLYRRVQKKDLIKKWNTDPALRKSFRRLQALAFIPPSDVEKALSLIKQDSPSYFLKILNYFENNYIGRIKDGNRCKPRYLIEVWNLYERIKLDLPRTNNSVESWHSRLKPDVRQNLSVAKVVELFRLEQDYMEADLIKLFKGETISKRKKWVAERNENIKNLTNEYKSELLEFILDGFASILDSH
ncbi:unnamed protein product [Brachionus calyciflorus]|uniref:MULE transposase domain-containing protein n=1 Tax=Brachionus calyciflorus TaxID=104777 RepID=A0A813NYC7_9BILA|nr:unnamed protein product [Brachionus calyciflorus]